MTKWRLNNIGARRKDRGELELRSNMRSGAAPCGGPRTTIVLELHYKQVATSGVSRVGRDDSSRHH